MCRPSYPRRQCNATIQFGLNVVFFFISPILLVTKTDHRRDVEAIQFNVIVESDYKCICSWRELRDSLNLFTKRANNKAADSPSCGKDTALRGITRDFEHNNVE